jgi:hypothetical protein
MTNDDSNNNNENYNMTEEDSRLLAEQEEYLKSQPIADSVQDPRFQAGGNGQDNGQQEDSKKDDKDRTAYFVQKCSTDHLIAEAIIVAGIPYYAVARTTTTDNDNTAVNITLDDSTDN